MRKREVNKLLKQGYDLNFVAKTQPQGNIKFNATYIRTGTGYTACLHVYRYPNKNLADFWLAPLVNQKHVISVVSVGTEDKDKIKQSLQNSIDEQKSRISGKERTSTNMESVNDFKDQARLLDRITTKNEVIKRLYTRLFVYAGTLQELEKRVNDIIRQINEFNAAVFVGEQKEEFQSILRPAMRQEFLPNKRLGTPISAYDFSGSYYLNHVFLDDPNGSYFGYSKTGGAILLDLFRRTEHRTRTFSFITGNAGMGKSTLLKKFNDDMFARGYFIRNFDVSNEYLEQTRDQNGTIITLDGRENRINPFEIFPTVTNEDGSTVDEINSFNQHVVKIKNMFSFMNPQASGDDLTLLENKITGFYIEQGMWTKNPQMHPDSVKVIGLPAEQYPTLSEFLIYLNQQKRIFQKQNRTMTELDSMNRIVNTFTRMKTRESDMFDGHTTIQNFEEQQVVTFDISGLKAHGEDIFNAQVFSVLNLISSHIISNGKKYRNLLKQHKVDSEDVPRYYLNIDEGENIINPNFTFGVETLASLMEQMRKNFTGITIACPTIKDLIPDVSGVDSPYLRAVKKIFSLMQYRGFFQLSDDDLPLLAKALGGSTTTEELQSITKLQKKQVLLNINGDRNIVFTVQATKQELNRYNGGE
ncbi:MULTISPECIES: ATP-binding protein [Liquorilactobacillus]|uniref:ATP-binding protein n=1 Tax=Liquorilactobacillus TaxID=2767888 RepID=UPI001CC0F33B|nr:ATP-binding protein [Liquorilactobacillus hordei]MBZ2406645.1 conjugal transfer protein [Liquorilactobacillus hordei]